MSHVACHMSYVKCLCWSLGHAEQLLFSCVSSKVSICNYVTCHMSHVTCHMSNAYVDPWAMLNNFCFHVYAQMSLFMGEKCNDYFLTQFWPSSSPLPVSEPIIELGSQLKIHAIGEMQCWIGKETYGYRGIIGQNSILTFLHRLRFLSSISTD